MSLPAVRDSPDSTPLQDEADLLRRAQAGDEDAFGEIVRAYYERVFRTVVGVVRDEHEARDVCQDVWITVWKNLGTFRGEAKFSTWLHPIATRRAIDVQRKRKKWLHRFLPFLGERDAEFESAPELVATEAEADPRGASEGAERRERFERVLAALPEKHRIVLVLREVQGLSYEQIAQTLNCRPGTVMSRLFNARRLLAQKLENLP